MPLSDKKDDNRRLPLPSSLGLTLPVGEL